MINDGNKPPQRLDRWKKGDAPSAAHLNQAVDTINKMSGVQPPRQVKLRTPLPDTAAIVCRFLVVSIGTGVKANYINAEIQDGTGRVYQIAKPSLLRNTNLSHNGVTYTYTAAELRTAAYGVETEEQVLVPSYQVDDEIYATYVSIGTGLSTDTSPPVPINWIDNNVDGRYWARKTK